MKQPYTTMHTSIRKNAKKEGITIADLYYRILQLATRKNGYNISSLFDSVNVDIKVENGQATHLYMPSREFCDWLVSCAKKSNNDALNAAQRVIGRGAGVLHFPTDSKLSSLAYVLISLDTEKYEEYKKMGNEIAITEEAFDFDGKGDEKTSRLAVSFSESENKPSLNHIIWGFCANLVDVANKSKHTQEDKNCVLYYCRLIMGLGMYISAFGDQVLRDGVPEDLKKPNIHKHQDNQSILVHDSVHQTSHESPTPHYRRGHFRLLKSNRFKHKQGQIVFVKDTFVKGQAKTVEDAVEMQHAEV